MYWYKLIQKMGSKLGSNSGHLPPPEGTGLPLETAQQAHNRGPRWPKLSSIDVTAKAPFERLYLVPGLCQFFLLVIMLSPPTPPPLKLRLFLDFCTMFVPSAPQFFIQHDLTK